MYLRERHESFWRGERPDHVPYTIDRGVWSSVANDPAWLGLCAQRLGVTVHIPSSKVKVRDLEVLEHESIENGGRIRRQTRRTPIGEISTTWVYGWHHKYLLETPADYRVMAHIVDNSEVAPDCEAFEARA